jgi:uncharacterized protein YecT (DUF1311 family)
VSERARGVDYLSGKERAPAAGARMGWIMRRPGYALAALATALALVPVTASASAAKLAPPVIHESFTPLPCPAKPTSTLDLEGCAEQRILRTDRRIDAVARSIFARLFDDAARRRFVAAQRAWLAYRRADCMSMSDRYEGGTLAGLVASSCTADRSAQRLKDLTALVRLLKKG